MTEKAKREADAKLAAEEKFLEDQVSALSMTIKEMSDKEDALEKREI